MRRSAVSGRRVISSALLAGALGIGGAARAAEPVRLSWVRGEGAEECASEKQIEERVTARLGEGAVSPAASRSIEALVARSDKGFRSVIYVRGDKGSPGGSREITSESESCASIEAASVLAIALAIDPDAALRPPVEPPPHPPAQAISAAPAGPIPPVLGATPGFGTTPTLGTTGVAPQTPMLAPPGIVFRPVPSVPAPAAPVPDSPGAGLSLRGGPGFGLLPAPAAGLLLGGFVGVGARFEITAEALWMPEARTSDRHFAFGLTALSLGVCRSIARAQVFDLGACAAVWGGSLHAVVYDLDPQEPGDYAWAAASLSPRLRVRVAPRVHLDLGAHVLVPFVRRSFQVAGSRDPVFQEPPVTVLPFLGGGVHFL